MTYLKLLSLFIGVLLMGSVLTSCSSTGSSDTSGAGDSSVQESDLNFDSEMSLDSESGAGVDPVGADLGELESFEEPVADFGDESDPAFDLEPDLVTEELASPSAEEDFADLVEAPPEDPALSVGSVDDTGMGAASMNSEGGFIDSADNRLSDLRYVSQKNGGTVEIETTNPASYQTREVPEQNQVVIELFNTKLPEALKRPYVTKDFRQAIASINAYQDAGSSTARVVIQFHSPDQASVVQSGKVLAVSPSGLSASSRPATAGEKHSADEEAFDDFDGSMKVASQGAPGGKLQGPLNASDTRILPNSSLEEATSESVRFYGHPISIETSDTPVRDVIKLIAEQSGANIVIANEVDGDVSVKLKQVPWDQALLLVMKSRGLGYVRQGSVLRIATMDILRKESEEVLKVIDARKAAEPLKVKVIPVSYAKVDQLQAQVASFLSPNRGKAVADVRTSSLVVTDIPENLERINNLVRSLDSPPLQVLIEGKVVEAKEVFARDIGIEWNSVGESIELGNNISLSSQIAVTPGKQVTPAGTLGFSLGTIDFLGNLNAALQLYENEDIVRIVSSPRIVTMNNESASILQGTNIPIPTQTLVNNVPVNSFEYKEVELRLEVTPQITAESDIIMQVKIKREFAGQRSSSAPDINRREANTKVLVRNGQTAVIGGIYQSDMTESETGIPWLRKIPILGWLFKRRKTTSDKNELLLFLTPRVISSESKTSRSTI